jgi:hypothetical protein
MGLHPNTCAYSKKPNYVVTQRRVIQQIYNQKIAKITFALPLPTWIIKTIIT